MAVRLFAMPGISPKPSTEDVMNRIITATASAAVMVTASASTAVADVTPPQSGHHGHACARQIRTIRVVSRAAGITIGSAFIAPAAEAFRPYLWRRQLDRAGLFRAGRAATAIISIPTNQAFVRVMTRSAADILDGKGHCAGGLPLN
jgi:hypothetical protein